MPPRPKLADPAALIRGGRLPEREFGVCLDPDLVAEHQRLADELAEAKRAPSTSLAGPDTTGIEERLDAARREVEGATVTLRLRALGRRAWRELLDQHQPRRDDDGNVVEADARLRVNTQTLYDPLIRASIVGPELDEDTLTLLLDERLTDAQYSALTTLCWNLNQTLVSIPFSSGDSSSRPTTGRK